MARIRILQSVSGLDFSWLPGEVVELPEEEAVKWADGYRAEYADESPAGPRRETTTANPGGETTTGAGGPTPRKAAAKKAAPRKAAKKAAPPASPTPPA